jgi:hypothetical protein
MEKGRSGGDVFDEDSAGESTDSSSYDLLNLLASGYSHDSLMPQTVISRPSAVVVFQSIRRAVPLFFDEDSAGESMALCSHDLWR